TKMIYPTSKIWNRSFVLGTDTLGRDILTRLMYGSRVSLLVAFVAAAVNMLIGILYGGISGYLGGNTDAVMMRIVDIISTIPLTLYVILIMVILGTGLPSIIVALGSVYWVGMARVVRGQVLGLKEQEFVLAAKTIGSSTRTILFQHLIPNAMGSILVTVTMLIPSAIFMEAFLGYLGIGLRPPMASLGTMCNDATENLRSCPHQLFIPALVICIIMFAFNFVGDGLRDALDPKLKK
ncbi:MAG: ABC transporter permease, partial [Hungatella sp.]